MAHYRTILQTAAIIALCFLGIPIRVQRADWFDYNVFRDFVDKYNRTYKNNATEYSYRLGLFKNSLRVIEELNSKRIDDNSAIYGVTQYSDMTREEYENNHLLLRNTRNRPQKILQKSSATSGARLQRMHKHRRFTLPQRVDWRDKGVVTKVRDQGTCGACWAHSTISTVESMLAIATGKLTELSIQQMVDCSERNMGCRGGDTCLLLSGLTVDRASILSKTDYDKQRTCKGQGVKIIRYTCDDMTNNEDDMLMALAQHGPLTAGVNALSWQNYLGGVIQFHCDGGSDVLNHAVQIVGYDLTHTVPHYILRNSWGSNFGNAGYVYVAIGDNICGLAEEVSAIDIQI